MTMQWPHAVFRHYLLSVHAKQYIEFTDTTRYVNGVSDKYTGHLFLYNMN